MKGKIVSVLMLTLILTNVLGLAFIIKPSFAQDVEKSILDESFMEKMSEATLPDKATDQYQWSDLNGGRQNILERKPDTNRETTSESSSQTSQNSRDRWNFNDTSEWSGFAYLDGNKTRLIVGVNGQQSTSLPKLEKIAANHHAKIVNTISIKDNIRAVVVELPLMSVTAFVEETRIMELASYIEPNMKVQAQLVPNDPYWSMQWGPQKIGADWAWNTTVGDPSVLVAVVDTGIYYTHPDLTANYVALGYDWVNNDNDPIDDHGHGTHCAGIIAATLNNGVGITGLAQVRIMAEKVLDSGGGGYWDWVADGIINATDCGAKIISMSLGGYGDSELLHDAVKYAYEAGVLVIAAAGNDNTNTKLYPAGYDEVIAVAATDQYDNKASFSNWGDWIELAAPGVDIYSTVPWGYESWSGTSMATPHVSGVAALVWSQYPNKTRDWVRLWLRYTADDLGDEGFDVYYGYGRVNARKAVAQSPPAHELILYDWETPPYVKPEASGIINATILNFGESNETDVTVQLLANGTIVDSTLIDLATGNVTTVSLAWSPSVEGLYNVTFFVVPVLGETSVENNAFWKYIYVGVPVKAVVLHSAGNIRGDIITNWQVLNSEWYMFGDTMIDIDYATLNKEDITYDDITATEADVLIISCAYDPYMGWQFTDSEIEALTRYVHEGHGLIATAGTFYSGVPNNNKLAPLFGLNETTMWGGTGTDLLHLVNSTHPILTNVPNPLVFPQVGTALPYDGRWDSNELVGGKYLALGHYEESAVVVYRGLVYISPWLEIVPPYYHHHLQLLYNAITWSRYQKPEHELAVSLESPKYLQPSESVLLNATVFNNGLNSETDVELYLSIDDTVVNSTTIAELLTDSSCTINYLWTPTVEATYNVTAYAPPVPSEETTVNNQESKFVGVFEMVIAVVLDSWGTDYGYNAFWDYLNTNWANYGTMRIIIDYTSLNKEDITLADIEATRADVLIISDAWYYGYGWEFADSEIEAIETYVRSDHGIIATSGTFNTMDGMALNNRKLADLFGMDPDIEYRWGTYTSGTFDLLTPRHDELWRNIPDPYLSDSILTIYPYPNSDWTIQGVTTGWIEALSTDHYATVITSDAITHKAVYFTGMLEYHGQYNENNRQLFYNAIVWTQLPLYEHELAVSLEAPKFLEPGDSSLLNATVYNRGLSNETNVSLELIINGTIVDSELIPELLTGASHTIDYLWIPVEGTYNITAYAPPVSAEEFAANNVATKIVSVRPIKYVLFDQTHGTDSIYSYSTWVTSLTNRGYVVETNTIDPITPIVLEGYDVFVIPQAYSSYSADELSAIQNFVFNGGGLLVIGDDNPWIYTELTSFAGIAWESGGTGGITTDITPHPVTTGVGSVYLSGPIAIMYVTGTAQDLVRDPACNIMLAVSEHLGGKVLGFADEDSLWDYGIGQADNLLLANNMIDWLTLPRQEHDLAVTLDAPKFFELGNSTVLRATVLNSGLNNETDVELYLLINDTVVSSVTIPQLLVSEFYTINYTWTPISTGSYNITAYAAPVPEEEYVTNNVVTKWACVFFYRRLHLSHEWIGSGNPMGWHADDASWQYTLPFDFPFYGVCYRTIYISSNGLITFLGPDASCGNSMPSLAQKLAIAPAWDDWITYEPYDVYIWQNSTHVGIRWYVAAYYNNSIVANFEAILSSDGVIQFNYEYNNGSVSTTIGISNGARHILAEDLIDLNYIYTIVFLPYLTIMGDVNGDGIVDISDLVMAVNAIPSIPGWPNWNPNADLNNDNRVDIADLVRIISYCGQAC
jgi:thermitase